MLTIDHVIDGSTDLSILSTPTAGNALMGVPIEWSEYPETQQHFLYANERQVGHEKETI